LRSLASDSWRRAEGLIDPAPSGRTTPCPRPTSPVPGNVGSRGEWMTDSRTRSACPASRSAPWRTRPPRTWFVPDIPSSRLHQLGVHGAALKAVRPRLRLRALRLDRVAAHTPAQTRPGPPKKRTPLTPSSYLTDPAPSWMTPCPIRVPRPPVQRSPGCDSWGIWSGICTGSAALYGWTLASYCNQRVGGSPSSRRTNVPLTWANPAG